MEFKDQKTIRMHVALWVYSYVDDLEYDRISKLVDVNIGTDRPDLDQFFKECFHCETGQWIHKHPELSRLRHLHRSLHVTDCSR
jgi:hypothetical protein